VFCGSFVLLPVLDHSHYDTQDVIMCVILSGAIPLLCVVFCFGLVVVVCFLLVFLLFFVCFLVCFLAGTASRLRTGPLPALSSLLKLTASGFRRRFVASLTLWYGLVAWLCFSLFLLPV